MKRVFKRSEQRLRAVMRKVAADLETTEAEARKRADEKYSDDAFPGGREAFVAGWLGMAAETAARRLREALGESRNDLQ